MNYKSPSDHQPSSKYVRSSDCWFQSAMPLLLRSVGAHLFSKSLGDAIYLHTWLYICSVVFQTAAAATIPFPRVRVCIIDTHTHTRTKMIENLRLHRRRVFGAVHYTYNMYGNRRTVKPQVEKGSFNQFFRREWVFCVWTRCIRRQWIRTEIMSNEPNNNRPENRVAVRWERMT